MPALNAHLLTLAATAYNVLAVEVTNSVMSATVDSIDREWNLKLPAGIDAVDAPKVPLVVELHGLTGTKDGNGYTGWSVKQKQQGFVLVQPQGIGRPGPLPDSPGALLNRVSSSWNAAPDACCGKALADKVDDVKFLREIVERTLKEQPNVDADRVYFVGHSNGCGMAQRMAAEASDLVTAVACMSLYMGVVPDANYTPVPILEIHGELDLTVPYVLPDFFPGFVEGAEDNVKRIGGYNGCDTTPVKVEKERYRTLSYESNCEGGAIVRLMTISEGAQSDHTPFGIVSVGAYEVPIPTTDMAYDFLVQYGTRGVDGTKVEPVTDNEAIMGSPATWLMTAVLASFASALF